MTRQPMRADARRNRNRVLVAAREVFGREGLDAPLALVAKTAGVSRATQHRHFPTRESLLSAIFDDTMEEIADAATSVSDPADAYLAALFATVAIHHRNTAFLYVFSHPGTARSIKQEMSDRFVAIISEPLAAAQAAGQIRSDLTPEDTLLLVNMMGPLSANGPYEPEVRFARARLLILDAISANPSRRELSG